MILAVAAMVFAVSACGNNSKKAEAAEEAVEVVEEACTECDGNCESCKECDGNCENCKECQCE